MNVVRTTSARRWVVALGFVATLRTRGAMARADEDVAGSSVAVAATYGGSVRGGALRDGPGVSLAIDEPSWRHDPEGWLDVRYLFPSTSEVRTDHLEGLEGRVGVSLRWWTYLRLGLGAGVDRAPNLTTVVNGPNGASSVSYEASWQPAARAFVRVVSRSWRGFSLSGTLLLDAVAAPYPTDTLRPGLTVEGWWRS